MEKHYEIADGFISELDTWYYKGICIGKAIRKQICNGVKVVEVDDGTDDEGRLILFDKPYCPDCEEISYSGNYCQHCGKRLRI